MNSSRKYHTVNKKKRKVSYDSKTRCRNDFSISYEERKFLENISDEMDLSMSAVASMSFRMLRVMRACGMVKFTNDGGMEYHYVPSCVKGYEQFSGMSGLVNGVRITNSKVNRNSGMGAARVDVNYTIDALQILDKTEDEFDC